MRRSFLPPSTRRRLAQTGWASRTLRRPRKGNDRSSLAPQKMCSRERYRIRSLRRGFGSLPCRGTAYPWRGTVTLALPFVSVGGGAADVHGLVLGACAFRAATTAAEMAGVSSRLAGVSHENVDEWTTGYEPPSMKFGIPAPGMFVPQMLVDARPRALASPTRTSEGL